jgi:hypothetical protein
MTARALWRDLLESYPCPVCDAGPGDPCRTATGNVSQLPHADRTRGAQRCRGCSVKLHAEADPLDYCDHCQLLRDLTVERYRPRPR